jgi:hypothetical protein
MKVFNTMVEGKMTHQPNIPASHAQAATTTVAPTAAAPRQQAVPQTQEKSTTSAELIARPSSALARDLSTPIRRVFRLDTGLRTNRVIKFSRKSQYADRIAAALPGIQEGQLFLLARDGQYHMPIWAFLISGVQYWTEVDWQTGEVQAASKEPTGHMQEDIRALVLVATDAGLIPAIMSARSAATTWIKEMTRAIGDKCWVDVAGTFRSTTHISGRGFPYVTNHADPRPINAEQYTLLKDWVENEESQKEHAEVQEFFLEMVAHLDKMAS